MRAHALSLVIAAALCWLIASLGTAPPASAVEEAPASAEAEEAAPSLDEGPQDAGEDPGFAAVNGPPRHWGFTVRINFGALVN